MMEKELKVGIGDAKSTRGEGSIITYALDSCIGIAFYGPFIHLGTLLHIMLPSQFSYNDINTFKYADSGTRGTVRELTAFDMVRPRTVMKTAGETKMFEINGNVDPRNIGARSTVNVEEVLLEERMRIAAEDIGGSYAKTMKLDLSVSSITTRTLGRPKKIL